MEILLKGNPTAVEGTWPALNEDAPDFTVYDLNDQAVSKDSLKGKVVLISTFPNIDTRVCDIQTRKFFELAATLDDVLILNLSNNDKENLSNWCATQGVDSYMLRDVDQSFAHSYGIWLPELSHLARSIFVLNRDGVLVYSELVPEVTQEPNYEKAVEAAKHA